MTSILDGQNTRKPSPSVINTGDIIIL